MVPHGYRMILYERQHKHEGSMSKDKEPEIKKYSERLEEMIDRSQGIVPNRFYTVSEAAKLVSLSEVTIKRHVYDKETLQGSHPTGGNALRIKGEHLLEWMDDE